MSLNSLQQAFSELHGLARAGLWILPSVAVLSGSLLIWTIDQRLEGYGFRMASYPTIYMPDGVPIVTGFKSHANTVSMKLTSNGLLNGNNDSGGKAPQKTAEFKVVPGVTSYRLTGVDFARHPGLRFSTISGEGSNEFVFSSSELLIGRFKQLPLEKLTASVKDFPKDDVSKVRRLLDDANISPSDPYELKFQKVWQFLDSRLAHAHGGPPDNLSRQPALRQYEMALDGKVLLYCENFAEIFALFGAAIGLHVRIVDAIRQVDGVTVAAHAFNEVFFPELGRWAYVDLNLGVMSVVSGPNGAPLNTIQLVQLHQAGAIDGLYVLIKRDDDVHAIPYSGYQEFIRLNLTANATYVFNTIHKNRYSVLNLVRRYLLDPPPAHALHGSNVPHLIKMWALWIMILSVSVWIAVILSLGRKWKNVSDA